MDDSAPLSPRDQARLDASRGAIHLMRVLLALGLLEGTAIVVDLATTELPAAALRFADTLRVLVAVAIFVVGARLQGWANVLGFGMWLWMGLDLAMRGWLLAKLGIVVALVIYHLYCGMLLDAFADGRNRHSHRWYRWFNELPVLLLLAAVILVVVKPF